ncbi:FAD-binding protein [Tomitella biformata]|uniref:FAD-binding protein n=1 Tax=Tomitella biformata TaxID=630403 RepID=UPI000467AEFC|nr:FAD-binding protein [Tomitella biformata]
MNRYDLVVVGAGMAGLTAAARAATAGQSVLVVEIGGEVGGSARYAGYAWTAPDREVMDRANPAGDETLRHALVDGFDEGVQWIASMGVEVGASQRILDFGGRGHKFDTNQYVDNCRRKTLDAGGAVWLETTVDGLLTDDGVVTGIAVTRAGVAQDVLADHVLLATGGFQGSPELLTELLGPAAAQMPLRSNPRSTGTGYRLGVAAGAATGFENAGFYGHLIPSGVAFTDADFVDLSLYYSEHALLFNLANERFTDETLGDHLTTMELLDQPESRGLLIADERVYQQWMLGSYVDGAVAVDKFALASKRGGRVGKAETLSELAYLPEEWGYDGTAIATAIEEFNAQVATGEPTPGRLRDREPLTTPPYYVIETIPAITFPFQGLRIDKNARVLTDLGDPIPGLLAAGSDTGGLWRRAYAGGIASALVFGLAAANTSIAGKAS